MTFSVPALLYTLGCCLISIIIASKPANKSNNKAWFQNLKHPDNSLVLKYINSFGFGFFLLWGCVLYSFFVRGIIAPIVITTVVILFMGMSPFLLFEIKNLKSFNLLNTVLFVLIPAVVFFLLQTNLVLAILVSMYFLWVVYETTYFYRLMKLNE